MPMGAVAMDESQTPPNLYLLEYILTLAIAAVVGTIAYKSAQSPKNLLASAGVSVRKVARAVREIERKTFHLAGLLVPLIDLRELSLAPGIQRLVLALMLLLPRVDLMLQVALHRGDPQLRRH